MGGLEDRLRDLIQATTDWLATMLPAHLTWMTGPAERTMEYALGPLIDRGGRFPWWGVAAGLAIATLVYFVEQRRADSGHRDGLLRFWFPREIYRNKSVWVDLKVGFVNSVLIGNAVPVDDAASFLCQERFHRAADRGDVHLLAHASLRRFQLGTAGRSDPTRRRRTSRSAAGRVSPRNEMTEKNTTPVSAM